MYQIRRTGSQDCCVINMALVNLLKTTSASTALLLVDMLLYITQEMGQKIPRCLLLHILTYVRLILRVSSLLTI